MYIDTPHLVPSSPLPLYNLLLLLRDLLQAKLFPLSLISAYRAQSMRTLVCYLVLYFPTYSGAPCFYSFSTVEIQRVHNKVALTGTSLFLFLLKTIQSDKCFLFSTMLFIILLQFSFTAVFHACSMYSFSFLRHSPPLSLYDYSSSPMLQRLQFVMVSSLFVL